LRGSVQTLKVVVWPPLLNTVQGFVESGAEGLRLLTCPPMSVLGLTAVVFLPGMSEDSRPTKGEEGCYFWVLEKNWRPNALLPISAAARCHRSSRQGPCAQCPFFRTTVIRPTSAERLALNDGKGINGEVFAKLYLH